MMFDVLKWRYLLQTGVRQKHWFPKTKLWQIFFRPILAITSSRIFWFGFRFVICRLFWPNFSNWSPDKIKVSLRYPLLRYLSFQFHVSLLNCHPHFDIRHMKLRKSKNKLYWFFLKYIQHLSGVFDFDIIFETCSILAWTNGDGYRWLPVFLIDSKWKFFTLSLCI